jgi:hypothetical protein
MNNSETELCCKLTSPELQKRKSTVLAELKTVIVEKQEVADGFVYTFPGTDAVLNQLMAFIQSERECCPFFKFELAIQDQKNPVRLKITGPDGAKAFIVQELDL